MGCFNTKGCMSNMPIECGDKVVAFVGLTDEKYGSEEFSPGTKFTPLTLPIHGMYNDYGGVYHIQNTASVKIAEEFFGVDIDTLVEGAVRFDIDGLSGVLKERFENLLQQAEDANARYRKIFGDKLYSNFKERFGLTLVMEHESVFYAIANANKKRVELINNDYSLDLQFMEEVKKYIQTDEYQKMCNSLPKDFTDEQRNLMDSLEILEYIRKTNEGLVKRNRLTFIAKAADKLYPFRSYLTDISDGINKDFFLYPFKTVNPSQDLRKDSVDFVCFMEGMLDLCLVWGVSNYYNQTVFYDECISVLTATLKLMKEKKKYYERD